HTGDHQYAKHEHQFSATKHCGSPPKEICECGVKEKNQNGVSTPVAWVLPLQSSPPFGVRELDIRFYSKGYDS
ncbi:MAG TPA: hypothetical protein VI776_00300, partial [Anaerolineales bacterium]|nr:hypothetical protein [Anaerolineales bacterium]